MLRIWTMLAISCSTPPVPVGRDAASPDTHDGAVDPREPFEVWRHREPIYELYVRHFSEAGTFKGVEAKLPELRALGIGIVWLLPVNEIGSKDRVDGPHGNPYAVKSYERVNPEYGSDDDLRDLVAAAHRLGMHVILDWVPNHTAWDHPLITEHPEWYGSSRSAASSTGSRSSTGRARSSAPT
jgi:glycosidase